MIQIRNVPPDLHERLKARADAHGMNLSDFLKGELQRMASVPTNAEIFAAVEADRAAGASSPDHCRRDRRRHQGRPGVTLILVVDASAIVNALTNPGDRGAEARLMLSNLISSPHTSSISKWLRAFAESACSAAPT